MQQKNVSRALQHPPLNPPQHTTAPFQRYPKTHHLAIDVISPARHRAAARHRTGMGLQTSRHKRPYLVSKQNTLNKGTELGFAMLRRFQCSRFHHQCRDYVHLRLPLPGSSTPTQHTLTFFPRGAAFVSKNSQQNGAKSGMQYTASSQQKSRT